MCGFSASRIFYFLETELQDMLCLPEIGNEKSIPQILVAKRQFGNPRGIVNPEKSQ